MASPLTSASQRPVAVVSLYMWSLFSFLLENLQARVYELQILGKYQKFLLTSKNSVLPTRNWLLMMGTDVEMGRCISSWSWKSFESRVLMSRLEWIYVIHASLCKKSKLTRSGRSSPQKAECVCTCTTNVLVHNWLVIHRMLLHMIQARKSGTSSANTSCNVSPSPLPQSLCIVSSGVDGHATDDRRGDGLGMTKRRTCKWEKKSCYLDDPTDICRGHIHIK